MLMRLPHHFIRGTADLDRASITRRFVRVKASMPNELQHNSFVSETQRRKQFQLDE